MFKVVVTLDYWPITQTHPTTLRTLAEVLCDDDQQAHKIGHFLTKQLTSDLQIKDISVHYNIY